MSNINVNEYLSSNDRNSDEFDVHIDFDEQNPGCGWGEDIPPSTIYQSEFGITFGNGPSLINECGNFGVSGHSSPVFIGNNYNNTPGDLLISFDNIVSKVQINAGTNSGTTFQMIGYDENNNQIVQSDVLNGINVLTPISVTANGIKSIRVVTSGGDVFVYDDLKIKTGSYQDSDSENYSLSFDGDGDYSHLDWNENLSVYTVSMWVKPNELNQLTFSGIFNTYNDDSNGFQLDVNNNQYRYHSSDINSRFGIMSLNWHHIVVRADGQKTSLYFNGDSIKSINYVNSSWNQIELGRNRMTDRPGNFKIDEVTIWNKALTNSEIELLKNGYVDANDDDLLVWWDMNVGQGDVLIDKSGNNNNAIIYGATWSNDVYTNEDNYPIKVAVVSSAPNSTKDAVAAQLNDDTFYDFTATTLDVNQADEISEISDYDIIIIGGSGNANGQYSTTFFSTLNTYLQNGGGILSTGWFVHETQSIYNYGDLASITPYLDDGSYHFQSPGQMSIVQNDHEVTSGISNFFPTCNYTEYEISIDPGAEQLGGLIGVENANTIIVHDHGNNGRTGYLGGMYMANTGYGNSNMRSGVEDQLLEQMVHWLAGGGQSNQNNPPIASSFVSSSVEDVV